MRISRMKSAIEDNLIFAQDSVDMALTACKNKTSFCRPGREVQLSKAPRLMTLAFLVSDEMSLVFA